MTYKNWAVEIHMGKFVFLREHKEESIARRWFIENQANVNDGVNQSPIDRIRLWNKDKLVEEW